MINFWRPPVPGFEKDSWVESYAPDTWPGWPHVAPRHAWTGFLPHGEAGKMVPATCQARGSHRVTES